MTRFDAQITFCYTPDLEATARFYEETMGLPLALDQGACRIYRVAEGAFLGFCTKPETPRPESVILTFVTADVDGWHERLRERGVACDKAPSYNENFQIYHCFVRDPNGYRVEIQRFEDPRWQG
jgi:catechol 2,3-dioxygenase-like lactoylglutathione lyase family enzyme